MRQRVLECRDDIDGGLDVLLGKRGQRPVAHAEQGATAIEPVIETHRAAVDRVASQRNPLVVARDHIEAIAVYDHYLAAVGGLVDVFVYQPAIAALELVTYAPAPKFLVIAGDVQ